MSLSKGTIEKAIRRLLALEQRIDKLGEIIPVLEKENVLVAGEEVSLTQGQKNTMAAAVSQRVATLEQILADLETEVAGSSTVTPQPVGAGITDWETAQLAITTLTTPDAGRDVRQTFVQTIATNMNMERDESGELSGTVITTKALDEAKDLFKKRTGAVKLVLAQLRGLGA